VGFYSPFNPTEPPLIRIIRSYHFQRPTIKIVALANFNLSFSSLHGCFPFPMSPPPPSFTNDYHSAPSLADGLYYPDYFHMNSASHQSTSLFFILALGRPFPCPAPFSQPTTVLEQAAGHLVPTSLLNYPIPLFWGHRMDSVASHLIQDMP